MCTLVLSGVQDGARGYVTDSIGNTTSLLSHIYIMVRSIRQQRRVFLKVLLRYFEDYEVHTYIHTHSGYFDVCCLFVIQKNPLGLLLYVADTLAYLPYNTLEEPLFVVHHIDMTISIAGSNLLQQFKEVRCIISIVSSILFILPLLSGTWSEGYLHTGR